MATLTQAHQQWATRPDDERFTSLPEMSATLGSLRDRSRIKDVSSRALSFTSPGSSILEVNGQNGTGARPTNWAFRQLAQIARAPSDYLASLPAPMAADLLNYGVQRADPRDLSVLLSRDDTGPVDFRAVNSQSYGRIWNVDIVDALIDRFGDGISGDFRVPGEFRREITVTKANTTLFAGDRDCFIFLADEKNRIEVPNRRDGKPGSLARGFFVWNSEVGSRSVGIAMFLFDYVCSNRMVWGAQGYTERRLRHTFSAPDQWFNDVAPIVHEYAESSAKPVQDTIRAAQHKMLEDRVDSVLRTRLSLTAKTADAVKAAHFAEEQRPIESLWDVATGITAHAKSIRHQDARIDLERKAGLVLDLVAV